MTNSVFYFFPILVAVTAAKRFKTSPYVAAVVMGTFIIPDFIAYVQGDGGNTVNFFGLNAPVFNYTSQVLPAIIATWIQSKFEHVMEKKIPTSLHLVVIPTVLILSLIHICHCAAQRAADDFDRFKMEHISHFPSTFCCISFNGMCQSIHTGRSSKSFWH